MPTTTTCRLRYHSTVRISKILAVDKQIVRRSLGSLSDQDLAKVEAGLRQALSLAS
jgi:mRNA-degrading endonuclease toxin of MazEF toxin-antitoxin module